MNRATLLLAVALHSHAFKLPSIIAAWVVSRGAAASRHGDR